MLTNKQVRVLQAARDLIADKSHWTTDLYAVDSRGNPAAPGARNACQFCAVGAVREATYRAYGNLGKARPIIHTLYAHAANLYDGKTLIQINDTLGHADVLRIFDAAIKAETPR